MSEYRYIGYLIFGIFIWIVINIYLISIILEEPMSIIFNLPFLVIIDLIGFLLLIDIRDDFF